MAEIHSFSGPDQLAEATAERVAALLLLGLAEKGKATLVVPGGRTPENFLTRLGKRGLDWLNIAVTLGDERWVGEDSPASNAAMVRRTLLANAPAEFLPLYNGAPTPEEGCASIEAMLAARLPWDAVILGMGDDGHFASLFPGEAALGVGLDPASERCCVAADGPANGPRRLSMTLSCLAKARHIFMVATGAHKKALWQSPAGLPIAALQALKSVPVDFLWCP
jgi:6-phosphogluconolactonase